MEWKRNCAGKEILIRSNDALLTLRFADDKAIFVKDASDTEFMFPRHYKHYHRWSLNMNTSKTE